MNITQYEQAGFIIESISGQIIALDIGALTPIEKLSDISVDYCLISHIHADHCSASHIAALTPSMVYTGAECRAALTDTGLATTEISDGDEVVAGDFTITVFEVDHGPNAPQVPAQNFGFMIVVDGQTIYFAGDMYTPSGIDVTELSVDVALLPVGGHFTFDAEAAFTFAQTFKGIGTIYPMHYEAVKSIDTSGKEKFRALAAEMFTTI